MNNEQIYYTQEGTPYILKSAGRYLEYFNAVPSFDVDAGLIVNAQDGGVDLNDPGRIFITNDKGILPLLMIYASVDNIDNSVVGIQTPYYYMRDADGNNVYNQLNGLSKSLANVENIVTNADALFDKYGLKYNQIVLTDKDFISPDIYLQFYFTKNLVNIARAGASDPLYEMVINRTYRIVQTIIWFEKQK